MVISSALAISILILLPQMGLSYDEVAFPGSMRDSEVSKVVVKFNPTVKLQGDYHICNATSLKTVIYYH